MEVAIAFILSVLGAVIWYAVAPWDLSHGTTAVLVAYSIWAAMVMGLIAYWEIGAWWRGRKFDNLWKTKGV